MLQLQNLNLFNYPDQPYLGITTTGISTTAISCSTPNSLALLTLQNMPLHIAFFRNPAYLQPQLSGNVLSGTNICSELR